MGLEYYSRYFNELNEAIWFKDFWEKGNKSKLWAKITKQWKSSHCNHEKLFCPLLTTQHNTRLLKLPFCGKVHQKLDIIFQQCIKCFFQHKCVNNLRRCAVTERNRIYNIKMPKTLSKSKRSLSGSTTNHRMKITVFETWERPHCLIWFYSNIKYCSFKRGKSDIGG